jgi:hypothetical protein
MSVTVKYSCGGCDAEAEGTEPLKIGFRSVSGRSWGLGSYVPMNSPVSVAPEGWMPFDPYTHCCYCPDCWAEIEVGEEK